MNIVTIVGARPQFIKAAAVTRAMREHNAARPERPIREILVHTGQHYDDNMSQVFFDELDIPRPDHNLGVGSLPHGAQTGRMLERIEGVLLKERPDWVLVYGDTNSTLAGALAAVKLHMRVAHVEAGLRSFNRRMPEEINRVLTDHVATLLFCPTDTAVRNLVAEGITAGLTLVGDVMCDSVSHYAERARAIEADVLARYGLSPKSYYLATIHRAQNTDDPARLREIVKGLNLVSSANCPVIMPLHPRTRSKLRAFGLALAPHGIELPPVPYLEMMALQSNARLVLTDSGGVQKEAFLLRVPCITLREETEWPETLESGWNRLVLAERRQIVEAVGDDAPVLASPAPGKFGDGRASVRIVERLASW